MTGNTVATGAFLHDKLGAIHGTENRRGAVTTPLKGTALHHQPSFGHMVAYFKYQSTKYINELQKQPGKPIWQRNYYEHVIRDEEELNRIRQYIQYIIDNPKQWELDRENPVNERAQQAAPLQNDEPWTV